MLRTSGGCTKVRPAEPVHCLSHELSKCLQKPPLITVFVPLNKCLQTEASTLFAMFASPRAHVLPSPHAHQPSSLPPHFKCRYIIPTPVVFHFLDDFANNGTYTGFPVMGVDWQRMDSAALRQAGESGGSLAQGSWDGGLLKCGSR